MANVGEEYMNIANSLEKKKCGYLNNHVCPLFPSKAQIGVPCDGCSLFETFLFFKRRSMDIEKFEKSN